MLAAMGFLLGAFPNTVAAGFGRIGSELQVNSSSLGYEFNGSIAPQADGGFTVVWSTASNSVGTDANVLSQSFDANGNAVGGEITINQTTAGAQLFGSVALASVDVPPFGVIPTTYTVWTSF